MDINELREFPGLGPAAFQHPLDVQATANLQKVPLVAPLLKAVSGSLLEKQMRITSISSFVRLGPNQGRSIYDKFVKAATILDLPELPDIYVTNQYVVNAYAYGIEKYQITLCSGLIDALTEDELMAVIGHELGHIKCNHMLYKTIAQLMRAFGGELLKTYLPAGTGSLALVPLQMAILHWERMAEFSCDRAGLLVVQDRDIMASALSKIAGGSQKLLPEINLDEVMLQAEEYEDPEVGMLEQIFKVNLLLLQTHPFPIVRTKEIMQWGESEQCQNILGGDYLHQEESPALVLSEPMSKVCRSCRQLSDASAVKCLACGSSLSRAHYVCSNCRIRVFPGWSTCPGCGSHLALETDGAMAA